MLNDDVALLSGGVIGSLVKSQADLLGGNVLDIEPGVDDAGNYTGVAWIYATNGRTFRVEVHDDHAERGFVDAADETVALAKELRG